MSMRGSWKGLLDAHMGSLRELLDAHAWQLEGVGGCADGHDNQCKKDKDPGSSSYVHTWCTSENGAPRRWREACGGRVGV